MSSASGPSASVSVSGANSASTAVPGDDDDDDGGGGGGGGGGGVGRARLSPRAASPAASAASRPAPSIAVGCVAGGPRLRAGTRRPRRCRAARLARGWSRCPCGPRGGEDDAPRPAKAAASAKLSSSRASISTQWTN